MLQPTIDQYLLSPCLLIIDELNMMYRDYEIPKLKEIADKKFNEMDITAKLGYYFTHMVHYTIGDGGSKGVKINHDLYIESKEFKIEIKIAKNWKGTCGSYSASKTWKEYQDDFDWLMNEIDGGNKGKVAFVIGWFNCTKSLAQLIQLGTGKGGHPLVNEERLRYFPFLYRPNIPTYTADLQYDYSAAYTQERLNLIGRKGEYSCIFFGNEKDCFHIACYY